MSTPSPDPPAPQSHLLPLHFRIVAAAAILGTLVLFVFALLSPSQVESRPSQFFLCAAIGVCLSVMFFVFWPDKYAMDKVPYLHLPVRVTGPVVLWIVVFLLLWTLVPRADRHAGLYYLTGQAEDIYYNSEDTLRRADNMPLVCSLIPDKDRQKLEAFYVEFPPGEDTLHLIFQHRKRPAFAFAATRTNHTLDFAKYAKE